MEESEVEFNEFELDVEGEEEEKRKKRIDSKWTVINRAVVMCRSIKNDIDAVYEDHEKTIDGLFMSMESNSELELLKTLIQCINYSNKMYYKFQLINAKLDPFLISMEKSLANHTKRLNTHYMTKNKRALRDLDEEEANEILTPEEKHKIELRKQVIMARQENLRRLGLENR